MTGALNRHALPNERLWCVGCPTIGQAASAARQSTVKART